MKDIPTLDEIIQEKEYCETKYSDLFKQFDEDETFYELDFLNRLKMPDEFPDVGIVLPTARDMVDANVDHIDITNARVYVNRYGTTDISRERAEVKRKFYLGTIYRTNVESSISPWRISAKHYALHGLTHIKTVWNADLWPDKPIQKKGESDEAYNKRIEKWRGEAQFMFPISIMTINPRNVMPDPHHIVPEYYIEVHKKACYNLINRYPHLKEKWGEVNESDEVEWVEWWDGTNRCIILDKEKLIETKSGLVEHNYGFIPYVSIESGLGNRATDGNFSARYVGNIRYMKDILIAESRAYSIADYILKSGAWPHGFLVGEGAKSVKQIDQKYGSYTPLPDGVKVEKVSPDVPPDQLRTWLSITSDYISSHAAPRSSRGLSEQGVRSGADRRQIMSEASLRFSHSIPAYRHGTARVLQNCIKLFKNVVPENIRLWSWSPREEFDVVVKREDIEEPYNCDVEFAPISPEHEYRLHDDIERQLQSGLLTKGAARAQMSNVDAGAMEEEEERERIRQSPSLLQGQDQYVGEAWGKATLQKQAGQSLQRERQLVPGGMGGPQMGSPQMGGVTGTPQPMGGMTTNVPNVATPAQNMQNELRNQRSPVPLRPNQGQGGGGARWQRP